MVFLPPLHLADRALCWSSQSSFDYVAATAAIDAAVTMLSSLLVCDISSYG